VYRELLAAGQPVEQILLIPTDVMDALAERYEPTPPTPPPPTTMVITGGLPGSTARGVTYPWPQTWTGPVST
jgi:hypothetical protein